MNNTCSFFFELMTDVRLNKVGWATYTQSDYIFYGDSQSKRFYVFKTSEMREYLQAHDAEYETRIATDYNRDGTIRKQSLGAIVPIELFCKSVSV